MRQAVLLGTRGTKRTGYMRQAAEQAGLPVFFVDWQGWRERLPGAELFVKIDPPVWESCMLDELERLAGNYVEQLSELSRMAGRRPIAFLNTPEAIAGLLDKRGCKKRLSEAGLPVTEEIPGDGAYQERRPVRRLLERMRETGADQVFIKPVKGSGAAGVSAFRRQPSTGRMALYTCALTDKDLGLVHTKILRRFSEPEEVFPLLERLLQLDCVIERWYAKAQYRGFSYDLRAVMQDGRMDFLLARLSKGPITNLQLNNRPLAVSELGLPAAVRDSVTELCRRAMRCFPGLRSAGIDILLERGSLRPRIIEMNAQGDLIYQDICQDNVIYRHQAEMMKDWLDLQKREKTERVRDE